MLTVYHNASTVRVVAGIHTAHAGSKSCRIAVYGNEATDRSAAIALALANETNASVRAAIMRIAGDSVATAPNLRTAAENALELLKAHTFADADGECF